MEGVVKALKDFFSRDLVFIVGGGEVILVIAYVLGYWCKIVGPSAVDLPVWGYIVGAGVAYAIGYALQDLCCLTRLCGTQANTDPNRFDQWLFERYEHLPWQAVLNLHVVRPTELEINQDRQLSSFLERTLVLMQVGTTMGPCSAVSGIALLLNAFCAGLYSERGESAVLGIGALFLVLGAILILLARLKRAQLRRDLDLVRQRLDRPPVPRQADDADERN